MKKKIMVLGMSPRVGGVETYIMNILRNIDRTKYEFYFPYYREISYRDELISLGGKLLKLEVSRHHPIKYIKYMNAIFEKIGFDAVYYNTCDIMSMDMIMFGKKHGVPVRIVHSHNSANIVPPNLLHRFTERWCRKHLDEYATDLLACSEVAGEWMFDGRNYDIVHNGIDTKKFTYNAEIRKLMRHRMGLTERFVVGFTGSLWEQKNPLFLLEVFEKVHKKCDHAHLLVVGDGPLRAPMQQMVKDVKLEEHITFLGVRSDVADLMNAMDCFVLPSKFEGLPFVLVEAQSCGLPCVVSSEVSHECDITENVSFLPLSESLDVWADTILNVYTRFPREDYCHIVREKGYDIVSTVEEVEKYLNTTK